MDYRDLSRLFVKLIGAVLVFWYIAWLPNAVSETFQAKLLTEGFLLHLIPTVVPLVLAFLIFMFPGIITNKLIDGTKIESSERFLRSLEILALRLIGVFYLFRGTVDMVYHVAKLGLTPRIYEAYGVMPPPTSWTPELAGNFVATVAELGLALWLTLGSQGIINLIDRVRGRDL